MTTLPVLFLLLYNGVVLLGAFTGMGALIYQIVWQRALFGCAASRSSRVRDWKYSRGRLLAVAAFGDEVFEFGIVVEDFEVGILEAPIEIRVAGVNRAAEMFERVDFHLENPVGARGVVENVGVVGAH